MRLRPSFASLLTATLCIAGSLTPTLVTAQMMPTIERGARYYNTVSVQLSAMNYFGDLAPRPAFASLRATATRPSLGVAFSHRFTPRLTGRAALSYGRISGDDRKSADPKDQDAIYRYNRNLSFRNDLVELSAVGVLDLFENLGSYLKRRDFTPYLFAGIAAFYHNPKAKDNAGNYVALQPLGTEGQYVAGKNYPAPYKRLQLSIPFGVGMTYKLDRKVNISYEIGWRKTFTDYLDDVSSFYAAPADLSTKAAEMADRSTPDTKAQPQFKHSYGEKGAQRGTSNQGDWYIVSGFHLGYIIVPATKSPKFR
jgi:Domain of unknown function (DUF6089)